MSSTENPGDAVQPLPAQEADLDQATTAPGTTTSENSPAGTPAEVQESVAAEVGGAEVTAEATGTVAVTPEAGTAEAPEPGDGRVADPTVEQAPADQAAVEQAPVEQAPVEQAPVEEPASHAVIPGPRALQPPAPATLAEHPHEPGDEAPRDPAEWGRVDDDGTVYVRTADGERPVGSWQAGDPAAGLAHYGRRYEDLATEVRLLEARLKAHTGNPTELKKKAQTLAESIPGAAAVGDLASLAARARAMVGTADEVAAETRAEKAAARAAQVARKEALAAEAEQIAAESTAWKAAGDRLKAIVEEWKTIRGIDRKTDEALWSRFAAARDGFGRRRGAHFAGLDAQRGEARAAKQALIAEAEKLATSTDWGPTSAAMRSLMDRWKAVPRTGRDGDDDLWKQFRAAQDAFFNARSESDKVRNTEQLANQQQKEELLAEAEKLDPTSDLRGAQNALRKIQERYDAIGHVPRGAMRALEDRMQAVEQKVRGAADSSRARTAPENPMVVSMRSAVTKAEEQLAKAEAAGDKTRIADAKANLATRREWLAEAEKSASRR